MVIETHKGVVHVSGSLHTNQWPAIKTSAAMLHEKYPHGVVIDFSGVRWMSQAGASTLTAAFEDIDAHHLPFVILNLSASIEPVLTSSISRRLDEGTEIWWRKLWGTA